MKSYTVWILILFAAACSPKKEGQNVENIINKAIARAGGEKIDQSTISFDFRDKFYEAIRNNGSYTLKLCSDQKCADTLDVLTNTGFERRIADQVQKLPDSLVEGYSNSVNSVHYFSVLPYGLNDSAVNSELLDTVNIKGISYYEIKVDFKEEGGGKDYEDEYMYWISTEDLTVDYLAYNYHVNEGGTRFREAYNAREINGVRVVDYRNYEPSEQFPELRSLDSLFLNDQLRLLSVIALKNVQITDCPNC
ncbi:MAG: DUF6503 family protein [Leeuwenhoekiella sp.]